MGVIMSNKYYDTKWFLKIRKYVDNHLLEQAIYEFEKYLQVYPNDCCSHVYYADALMKYGRLEEAKEVLDNVIILPGTPEVSKQDLIIMRIKLLSCQQKYEECYKLFQDNLEIFQSRDFPTTEVLMFLKKQLNLLADIDYSGYSYRIDQITAYSEVMAIEHIRKLRFVSVDENNYTFNEDFLLEDVYYKLRELLPLEEKYYNRIIENSYIFKYDNCGRVNGKRVDYLEVVTLQGSNDIIMMYPYENKERISCIDLTIEKEVVSKVKRISQIDKFNQKYGK